MNALLFLLYPAGLGHDNIVKMNHFDDENEYTILDESSLKIQFPLIYKKIREIMSFIGLKKSKYNLTEVLIEGQFFEIQYSHNEDESIYFLIDGEFTEEEIINVDFELGVATEAFFEEDDDV